MNQQCESTGDGHLKKSNAVLGTVVDYAMPKKGVQDPMGHGAQQILHHSYELGLGVRPTGVHTALHQRLQGNTSPA